MALCIQARRWASTMNAANGKHVGQDELGVAKEERDKAWYCIWTSRRPYKCDLLVSDLAAKNCCRVETQRASFLVKTPRRIRPNFSPLTSDRPNPPPLTPPHCCVNCLCRAGGRARLRNKERAQVRGLHSVAVEREEMDPVLTSTTHVYRKKTCKCVALFSCACAEPRLILNACGLT